MMQNVFKAQNTIFKNLKEYVEANSKHSPLVARTMIDNITPLVVFEEMNNTHDLKSTQRKVLTRNLNYYINIYAITTNNISSVVICEEISQLVLDVMQDYYGMNGGITTRIPRYNGEATTYQMVLTFSSKYDIEKQIIY